MAKRNANFDLLKIFAMLGIILFHHFGNKDPNHFIELTGGFTTDTYFYDYINNVPGGVSKVSLLMDFCYCHFGNGGNYIFMLITGYFLFGRDMPFPKRVYKISGILYAILFHGIILTIINFAVLKLFYPFSFYESFKPIFNLPNWLSEKNLWYLQAYGLFILVIIPLLKLFEKKLDKKTHLSLAATLVFINFLSYSEWLPNLWISSRLVEFTMCYYIGGFISKYDVKIKKKSIISAILIYFVIFFTYQYYWRYTNSIIYKKPVDYSYVSDVAPFVFCFIYALLCFLFFNNLHVNSDFFSNVLKNCSSTTMGIYIFHAKMVHISTIMANEIWWHDWTRNGYFMFSILNTLILFVLGYLIDKTRQLTYKKVEKKVAGSFMVSQ